MLNLDYLDGKLICKIQLSESVNKLKVSKMYNKLPRGALSLDNIYVTEKINTSSESAMSSILVVNNTGYYLTI